MPRRPLLAWTALALLAAAPTGLAVAGGGKSTPPPAKPAPATADKSLAELEAACDAAEEGASRDMRRKRYERVVAYLGANASAKDAERALGTAMDLAEELEDWAKTAAHADAYLKAYPAGKRKVDALVTKAGALGHVAAKPDVVKAYDAAVAAFDVEKHSPGSVVAAYTGYAEYLADVDDLEGAKAVLQRLKDAFAEHGASDQVSTYAEEVFKAVGTDPTPIPEGAKDLDGKQVSLEQYKGKVVLIDFWATWCAPCRAEIPTLLKAYRRFHDKGFEILGVSLDRAGKTEELTTFLADHGMPWRQVYAPDGNNPVPAAYEVDGIPHTVLVGRDGKILRVGLRGERLLARLERLFAAK